MKLFMFVFCAFLVLSCKKKPESMDYVNNYIKNEIPQSAYKVINGVTNYNELHPMPKGLECFNQHRVFICYKNRIDGYDVKVMLFPQYRVRNNCCRAIISLSNQRYRAQFVHDGFIDTIGYVNYPKDTVLYLDYQPPKIDTYPTFSLECCGTQPFCFIDIDFDGSKELLLTLYEQGQKWSNAYLPINLDYDYLYDNLKEPPFTQLDDLTEIDYNKHSIKLIGMDGAHSWFEDLYIFKPGDSSTSSGSKLITHIGEEHDEWTDIKVRNMIYKIDTTEWRITKRKTLK